MGGGSPLDRILVARRPILRLAWSELRPLGPSEVAAGDLARDVGPGVGVVVPQADSDVACDGEHGTVGGVLDADGLVRQLASELLPRLDVVDLDDVAAGGGDPAVRCVDVECLTRGRSRRLFCGNSMAALVCV